MDNLSTALQPEFEEATIPAHWARAVKVRERIPSAPITMPAVLPAPGDFAWLLPILFLFARMNGASGLLGDGDTGWHIRTGEWILANGRVPFTDIFSFSRPGEPWFAWEWLSDVAMGLAHRAGGMQAVLLGSMVLLSVTFFLLYRLLLRKSGSVLIAFGVTALAAGGSAIHWLARPHLFTLLLVVIFCEVLDRAKPQLTYILPALSLIWTNLHGGFLAGIVLTGAYAAGETIQTLLARTPEARQQARTRAVRYSLALLGCVGVSFVNPYGWHLHQHLFNFLTKPAYFRTIAEFTSLNFRHPLAPFFEVTLMLALGTAFWNLTRGRIVPVLLLLGWAHLALQAMRNIPIFLLVAAPHIAMALSEWLTGAETSGFSRAVRSLSQKLNRADEGRHWYVTGPLFLLLIARAMYVPAPAPLFQSQYDARNYPAKALATLRGTDRIFTSDTWGGYLIYHRYPEKVFVDGRSDFYGPDFETAFLEAATGKYTWEATLRRHNIDTVLLPVSTPLSGILKMAPGWNTVYDDGMAIVFRAVTVTGKDAK